MRIAVQAIPAKQDDSLIPAIDPEVGLLEWTSLSANAWAKGFDVDGLVVFDCDSESIIKNIELLIPEGRWERARLDFARPSSSASFCLRVAEEVFREGSLRISVEVHRSGNVVRVGFASKSDGDLLPLSSDAYAVVNGPSLVALYAVLKSSASL